MYTESDTARYIIIYCPNNLYLGQNGGNASLEYAVEISLFTGSHRA